MCFARFSPRLTAFFLDLIILGIPYLFILSIFIFPIFISEEILQLMSQQKLTEESLKVFYNSAIKIEIVMIFTWGAISALFISSNIKATPGKKIMKLQVVNKDNSKLKFFPALGRVIALPLIILTLQTPERYMVYEKLDKTRQEISNQMELASYLQTPISSLTNILTLVLISFWYLNITRDSQRRAFHDILFDTRVIYVEER